MIVSIEEDGEHEDGEKQIRRAAQEASSWYDASSARWNSQEEAGKTKLEIPAL